MQRITSFVLAVYNFLVGDPIILSGIALLFIIVGLLGHLTGLDKSGPLLGIVLIAGIITSLALALRRETIPKKR